VYFGLIILKICRRLLESPTLFFQSTFRRNRCSMFGLAFCWNAFEIYCFSSSSRWRAWLYVLKPICFIPLHFYWHLRNYFLFLWRWGHIGGYLELFHIARIEHLKAFDKQNSIKGIVQFVSPKFFNSEIMFLLLFSPKIVQDM